ncbi:hypothetical protein G6011_02527 [Alternaria panax]|uniref:Uncharacterized protein n=1 Tax=Alternaria panax TaxID=48097 RepID=A0AAD4FAT6_9PLEO|nr:hypothetical protein G6011_02527 [Alternaria panax]
MSRRQNRNKGYDAERQALLSDLDEQMDLFDTKFESLIAEYKVLERARNYIVSADRMVADNSDESSSQERQPSKLPMKPTHRTSSSIAKKAPSSLRQQVLIRNAKERDQSPSSPESAGLLSSDEFEAAFKGENIDENNEGGSHEVYVGSIDGGKQDVRMSSGPTSTSATEVLSAPASTPTANPSSQVDDLPPTSGVDILALPTPRSSQGGYWHGKRVRKCKLQQNAAKAREAKRRKLASADLTTAQGRSKITGTLIADM